MGSSGFGEDSQLFCDAGTVPEFRNIRNQRHIDRITGIGIDPHHLSGYVFGIHSGIVECFTNILYHHIDGREFFLLWLVRFLGDALLNGFLHIVETVNVAGSKLCPFNSGQLVGDKLTAFLGDVITRHRLILAVLICTFFEKIGRLNFELS